MRAPVDMLRLEDSRIKGGGARDSPYIYNINMVQPSPGPAAGKLGTR